jgi:hypothetical protein
VAHRTPEWKGIDRPRLARRIAAFTDADLAGVGVD